MPIARGWLSPLKRAGLVPKSPLEAPAELRETQAMTNLLTIFRSTPKVPTKSWDYQVTGFRKWELSTSPAAGSLRRRGSTGVSQAAFAWLNTNLPRLTEIPVVAWYFNGVVDVVADMPSAQDPKGRVGLGIRDRTWPSFRAGRISNVHSYCGIACWRRSVRSEQSSHWGSTEWGCLEP